jgi:preprotein translocase SecE subunit
MVGGSNPSWPGVKTFVIQKTIVFFKDVQSELAQVSWPTPRELVESTKVVLVTMFLLSMVIGLFDAICAFLISRVLR